MTLLQRALIFGGSAAMTCVFFINFCNLIYHCGCQSLWAGADAHCNIHTPGVRHCPWCSYGVVGEAVAFLAVIVPQFAASFWPGRLHGAWRLALALIAFPVSGALVAAVFGIITGYWR
jgi:hypothetical protein